MTTSSTRPSPSAVTAKHCGREYWRQGQYLRGAPRRRQRWGVGTGEDHTGIRGNDRLAAAPAIPLNLAPASRGENGADPDDDAR